MKRILDKSQEICENIKGQVSKFDPTIIIVVASVLVDLIKAYKDCKADENFKPRFLIGKKILIRKVERLTKKEVKRIKLSEDYVKIISEEILKEIETLDVTAFKEYVEEV